MFFSDTERRYITFIHAWQAALCLLPKPPKYSLWQQLWLALDACVEANITAVIVCVSHLYISCLWSYTNEKKIFYITYVNQSWIHWCKISMANLWFVYAPLLFMFAYLYTSTGFIKVKEYVSIRLPADVSCTRINSSCWSVS